MEKRKIIGVGNTATIYEWEEGKVLKLFSRGRTKEEVEIEFHNSIAVRNMTFAKPRAYEMIFYEGSYGIVYDWLKGESLTDWVMRTGELHKCAVLMAELHKNILKNTSDDVPCYKEFLKFFILNETSMNHQQRDDALYRIDKLPDGNALCHGDFHPGNILISNEETAVIDYMNVCYGDYLYDIARTVFLVEYTPVPAEASDREVVAQMKSNLADLYLEEMKVSREMIREYIEVISIIRRYECPNEYTNSIFI